MEYSFHHLSAQEVVTVINALAEQPFRVVAGLLPKLQQQAAEQEAAAAKPMGKD